MKKVFVSGCFDMLHSGHIAFFEEASKYGELYVGLGSDSTIKKLKGIPTINTENERLYMVKSIKYVKNAWINSGEGLLDFKSEFIKLKPDFFFVNEDGFTTDKIKICKENNVELIISKRTPHSGLPKRSTTELRTFCNIPYRLDLAGGWLDQPFVSKFSSGQVITISIEPTYNFNHRSGMSSSTRIKAIQLWKTSIPNGDKETLAKSLFAFENIPGTEIISGSQDSIGIVYPGVNRLYYEKGNYWPDVIQSETDDNILDFLENSLWLITLNPRVSEFDVLENTNINEENVKKLAEASDKCWAAIQNKDINMFGESVKNSFYAQIKMFPNMVTPEILNTIELFKDDTIGWKLSGAGGGGYLVLISEKPIKNALKLKIVRKQK